MLKRVGIPVLEVAFQETWTTFVRKSAKSPH